MTDRRGVLQRGSAIELSDDDQKALAPVAAKPRTAIGSMAAFIKDDSKTQVELDTLRSEHALLAEKHAEFEGAAPVRMLEPSTIRRSPYANRHPDSFKTAKFQELLDEIKSAGGNTQAIQVRAIREEDLSPEELNSGVRFEVVFGHRRHQACLELGIPVKAEIAKEVSDRVLFVSMDRENRVRADLSAYEQGCMYAQALDRNLFSSMRQLAAALNLDHSVISRAIGVAKLPQAVLEAFDSPLDISYRMAESLSDLQQNDPEALIARAVQVKKDGASLSSAGIFRALLSAAHSVPTKQVVKGKQASASIRSDAKGRLVVKFDTVLDAETAERVRVAILGVLS